MRIVHVIESLEFGGAERVSLMLANGMSATDTVTILCVKQPGELAGSVDRRVRVISLGKGEGSDVLLPWRLARVIREERAEVLHGHNWGIFFECGLAGRIVGVPKRLHTIHGPYPDCAPGWKSRIKYAFRRLLERAVARTYHRLVPVSEAIRDYMVNEMRLKPEIIETIHNGIALDAHAGQAPTGAGGLTFISVGRLAEVKNHELMLDAFAALAPRPARARLVLVGDGPRRAALDERARRLGIATDVAFLGFRNDIAALLAGADVYLVSSHYEGVSMAVLEAMRARLPVIATRVGGMPETVRDGATGLLVPPGDVAALTAAMARLASAPGLRRSMGNAGFELLAREFSFENMLARYRAVYRPLPAGDTA